jgi:16S rRNA (guanine527-N7)-methyltransferase
MNITREHTELIEGTQALGLSLDSTHVERLIAFLDLVDRWNPSAGITTIPREQAVRLHLLDSLAVGGVLGDPGLVADLGTGGGFPGIPMAIIRPDVSFTLIDSHRRRTSFLSQVKRELGLPNVEVHRSDVRELSGPSFDLVMSRAFRDPEVFLALALPLLKEGGSCVVMMAARTDTQIEELCEQARLELLASRCFTLPAGDERRTILRVRPLPA